MDTLYRQLRTEEWLHPLIVQADPSSDDEQKWQQKLETLVRVSQAIVVCLSPDALLEKTVIAQSIWSIMKQSWPVNLYVILLKLKPCGVPKGFSQRHILDYFEPNDYRNLLEVLQARAADLGLAPRKPLPLTSPDVPPVQPSIISNPSPVVLSAKSQAHEAERKQLLRELQNLKTTPKRRQEIGERLGRIGDTRPGIGVRSDGIPDIVWLPVTPGGQLTMRQKTYRIQPFFIAKYLVTYAQYKTFINAKDGYRNSRWWQGISKKFRHIVLMTESPELENQPRNHLNFYQSLIFSRWLNHQLQGLELSFPGEEQPLIVGQNAQVRLPLHEEWQWAAQGGTEARPYPWGDWQEGFANTYEAALRTPISAGMFPQGAALCGAEDMRGNLWERCLTVYPGYSRREIRGGYYYTTKYDTSFLRHGDFNQENRISFRLVVSFPVTSFDV